MPMLQKRIPVYGKHRASGQAIVSLNGRDFYLGPHRSKTSKLEYDRLIGEWLQQTRFVGAFSIGISASVLCFRNLPPKKTEKYLTRSL